MLVTRTYLVGYVQCSKNGGKYCKIFRNTRIIIFPYTPLENISKKFSSQKIAFFKVFYNIVKGKRIRSLDGYWQKSSHHGLSSSRLIWGYWRRLAINTWTGGVKVKGWPMINSMIKNESYICQRGEGGTMHLTPIFAQVWIDM